MKNNWQAIWNNRQVNLAEIDKNDEEKLILELKRMIGGDFFGKGSKVTVEDYHNEYKYFKENLRLPAIGGGRAYLKLAAAVVQCSISFRKTALKLAA